MGTIRKCKLCVKKKWPQATPIALTAEGGNVRSMPWMISDAQLDKGLILKKCHRLVSDDIGTPEGILIIEETSFAKRGKIIK